jgi:hypothetical protein
MLYALGADPGRSSDFGCRRPGEPLPFNRRFAMLMSFAFAIAAMILVSGSQSVRKFAQAPVRSG